MANPIIRKRTIQHPGFEFFETDMSIYKEYVQNTDALIVGYFSKGPINTPVQLLNLNDYTVYFGTPESEAEVYFFKGIESVINSGGTVTAVRLPYNNATAEVTGAGIDVNYKALVGNFTSYTAEEAEAFKDITAAYKDGVSFKNITFKPKYLKQDEITAIIGGTSTDEFAIINKYNDILVQNGEEIFVTVLGIGNAIRHQGLENEEETGSSINIYKLNEKGRSSLIGEEYVPGSYKGNKVDPITGISDEVPLTTPGLIGDYLSFSRPALKWENNGQIDENGVLLTVADSFEESILPWIPVVPTFFETDDDGIDHTYVDPRKDDVITVIVSKIKPSVIEPGKFTIQTLETFSGSIFKGSIDPVSQESNYIGDLINEGSNFISFYGKKEYNVGEGSEAVGYDPEEDSILVSNLEPFRFSWSGFEWKTEEKIQKDAEGAPKFTDKYTEAEGKSVDFFTAEDPDKEVSFDVEKELFVKSESGELLPVWKSPVYKFVDSEVKLELYEKVDGEINVVSGAAVIDTTTVQTVEEGSFKLKSIENDVATFVEMEQDVYTGEFTETATEIEFPVEVASYIVSYTEAGETVQLSYIIDSVETNETLEKSLIKQLSTAEESRSAIVSAVLSKALHKVKNNITYLFRDFYDCGLSSVIAYAEIGNGPSGKDKTGLYYNPTKTDPSETVMSNFLNATAWKKSVLECARFCQYKHKLSMFHADSPRKLVLNGNLSRCDDIYQDQDITVFTPKKVQVVSIKDNTYLQQNAQWYETTDEFNKTMIWIPSSIKLAKDITWNDINGNPWDAPAGHRYGPVTGVKRIAFNPEPEIMDRLYSNCINYGVAWPDGAITIEGQKTAYSEISTLNRINARRLLIWLERYSQTVAHKYIYEPNTVDNRAKFVADLETEFKRCYTLGGLYAYRIVCDETNNPPEVIDRNELRVAIMVQIAKTIEFVIANFIITKTGANLEEISPVF